MIKINISKKNRAVLEKKAKDAAVKAYVQFLKTLGWSKEKISAGEKKLKQFKGFLKEIEQEATAIIAKENEPKTSKSRRKR